ncbi:MAG TPA: hypothetical protein VEJ63_06380 [Planctomycetota bacterium]|nr:hypothetical protein [Planctomycetota bacterium]
MATARPKFLKERSPRILMVDSDPEHGKSVTEWLQQYDMKPMWVRTCREAMDLMYDMVFIESSIDAILVEHSAENGSGKRVIQEFRHEFPGVAAALTTSKDDIALELWSRARQVPILRRPLVKESLAQWLDQFRVPA